MEVLLQHGRDMNGSTIARTDKIDEGETASFFIVRNFDLVKWMLEHGADPNARDRRDRTPLEHAASYSSTKVVELMISHGTDLKRSNAF